MQNICDSRDCPAAAAYVVLTTSGVLTFCAHHMREQIPVFAAQGYQVLEGSLLERTSA